MALLTFQRLFLALRLCPLARLCATRKGYLPAKETINAAERAGLPVCQYVEKLWDQVGDTEKVVDQISALGALDLASPAILEIGAGTGRYLERVLAKNRPLYYESYETATDWADYLSARYGILSRQADGVSLSATADGSVDFLHAHGVFVYLSFLNSLRYFREIFRVLRTGGFVVFDIYSEACFDDEAVNAWLMSGHDYPCFLSREYVATLFLRHGFTLVGSFFHVHGAGRSEYLVFRRLAQADRAGSIL